MDGSAPATLEWPAAVTPLRRRNVAPLASPATLPATTPATPLPLRPRRGIGPADLEFMLDCVADGLVVVDPRGRVLHANRAARELLAQVRDVARGCGALVFRDRATQRAFERALAGTEAGVAAWPRDADGVPWHEPEPDAAPQRQFLVRDAGGVVVARAAVEPLQRACRDPGSDAAAHLVSLHPQPAPAAVSTGSLSALYRLTACEARVAAATLAAQSVDDLAQRLGLSRNTVKTHLKRVFRKCEVASFAQLAALVATAPRLR